MSDTVQKIKERLSIVDVVAPYVKLTRAGKYWKGLSPFTKEKTPSFFVTPERGLYHCFSTGKGGDMFTFIEEMEGVDFKGALRILAEKAGVEIEREAPGARGERDELYAALAAADDYYRAQLKSRTDAKNYLGKRGIDEAIIHHWHIGYAPKEWHALKDQLVKNGFSESVLERAGLIKKADNSERGARSAEPRSYDRFRGRIMFPIFDASGRVIAFSGRIFPAGGGSASGGEAYQEAKYLNSPEGPLFDKSRALYGIHEAKNTIRTLDFSMLVEGQVDLLLAHKAGYRSAVATSGTAFTGLHADILKRYSDNVLIAYDGDAAGVAAAGRAAALLLPRGMNVKVVRLPTGVDPADLIHQDAQKFKEAVKSALPVVDFFIAEVKTSARDERTFKTNVGRVVLPYVALIGNALEQSHFIARIAEAVGATSDAVVTELKKIPPNPAAAIAGLQNDPFFTNDRGEKLIFGILKTFEDSGDTRAERLRELFTNAFGPERLQVLRHASTAEIEEARIIASENFFVLYPDTEKQNDILVELEAEATERNRVGTTAYEQLKQELKIAEAVGNQQEVARIMAELSTLSKRLH